MPPCDVWATAMLKPTRSAARPMSAADLEPASDAADGRRDPRYVPQSPWGPASALAVTLLAVALPVAMSYGALLALGGPAGVLAPQDLERIISLASPLGLSLTVMGQLASLGVIWWAAGRSGQRAAVLRQARGAPGLGYCLAAGGALVVLSGLVELVMYLALGFDPFTDSAYLAEGLRSPLWWGSVLVAVVLAPLWEEMTFRGFLMSALAQSRLGLAGAGLLSNTLWTLLHAGYSLPALITVFLMGLMLTGLVWRTGAVRPAIVAHAVANAVTVAFVCAFAPAA